MENLVGVGVAGEWREGRPMVVDVWASFQGQEASQDTGLNWFELGVALPEGGRCSVLSFWLVPGLQVPPLSWPQAPCLCPWELVAAHGPPKLGGTEDKRSQGGSHDFLGLHCKARCF